jgi:hypothetical protein
MRLLLLFASLITSYALMIHAIFRAYRCRRCEVCKWCRDDVREAGEAVREERRGGRGQFRTRRKLIKHRFELHVCVSMPSWCMGPSLACTPSSPGFFWGAVQRAGGVQSRVIPTSHGDILPGRGIVLPQNSAVCFVPLYKGGSGTHS